MPTYTIDGRSVKFEGRGVAWLPKTIAEVIDFQQYAVVRLEVRRDVRDNQNVYGVDTTDGRIMWQIEPATRQPETDDDPYTAISRGSYRWDRVCAFSWSCWVMTIDVETGRLLSRKFTK